VPADLSSITKLKGKGGLLEALRPASENAASLPPADAVIALNQLKRLRPSSLSRAPPAELIDQMDAFVVAVTVRSGPSQSALADVAFDTLLPRRLDLALSNLRWPVTVISGPSKFALAAVAFDTLFSPGATVGSSCAKAEEYHGRFSTSPAIHTLNYKPQTLNSKP
jgi:hypothetical protein